MLAAIDLRVYPKTDVELPHPCGHMVHAALLDAVQAVNPSLSSELHETSQVKPFALSTLWPRTRASGDSLAIAKYTECRLRICTLTRPLFEAVSAAVFPRLASNGSIRLAGHEFTLIEANLQPPYGGAAEYAELKTDRGREIELRFTSPATFRRRGLNVPLPDPALVYGSLWQKWQAFSGVPVPESVFEEMMGALALSRMDGHTRVWKFPRYMMTGFVGAVAFELVGKVSRAARELFGALSGLAFFSGVGYRTTMGMGQCRIAAEESGASEEDAAEETSDPGDRAAASAEGGANGRPVR